MYKSWMWKQRSFREQFQGDDGGASAGGSAVVEQQSDDQGGEQQGGDDHQQDDQQSQVPDEQGQGAAQDDEMVISFGDEPPPASNEDEVDGKPAPQWVKDLRKQARDLARENRELKQAQQAVQQQTAPKDEDIGPEPDLADEDIDYDKELFKQKWTAWNDRKKAAEAKASAARQEQEAQQAAFQQRLSSYKAAGAALKVQDFADAEAAAQEVLNSTQLGIIVNGADNPAQLVYALGKSPAKAKELAAIKDPVKYIFAVAKLETQLKVVPRKTPPAPERQVRGTAGGATGMDSTEARLEAEADRTGNRTALIAYRKQKKNQVAA